jgi:hypothetical protein
MAEDMQRQVLSRKQLADLGDQQVQQLLKISKQILDACSSIQPTTQAQQQLKNLQENYLQISQDIRSTLQQCQALEVQETAATTEGAFQWP